MPSDSDVPLAARQLHSAAPLLPADRQQPRGRLIPDVAVPITHRVDKQRGLLLVERSGAIETQDERAALESRRADPGVVPGIRVLVDSRGVVPPDSPKVVRYIANQVTAVAAALRCGAVALVVGSDVQYGMARMYQSMTELSHPQTKVFRDVDAAVEWLLSTKGKDA